MWLFWLLWPLIRKCLSVHSSSGLNTKDSKCSSYLCFTAMFVPEQTTWHFFTWTSSVIRHQMRCSVAVLCGSFLFYSLLLCSKYSVSVLFDIILWFVSSSLRFSSAPLQQLFPRFSNVLLPISQRSGSVWFTSLLHLLRSVPACSALFHQLSWTHEIPFVQLHTLAVLTDQNASTPCVCVI